MSAKNKKLPVYLGVAVLLLVFLRFGLYFLKSGGFNGLSMLLPVLLFGVILFGFCTSAAFAAWVYYDCKIRRDDPVLWAVVVLLATPFIGLLVYFFRRPQFRKDCPVCGHLVSLKANFCEECGIKLKNEGEKDMLPEKRAHHLLLIAAGAVSMIFMLACLTGFITSAAAGHGVNTDVSSSGRVWNLGVINMNVNSYNGGVWKLDFKNASDGFVKERRMEIADAHSQKLYADIECQKAPEGASLVLWMVQKDTAVSVDVTGLNRQLEHPLEKFENGEIIVRLQINGVEDTVSEICIR